MELKETSEDSCEDPYPELLRSFSSWGQDAPNVRIEPHSDFGLQTDRIGSPGGGHEQHSHHAHFITASGLHRLGIRMRNPRGAGVNIGSFRPRIQFPFRRGQGAEDDIQTNEQHAGESSRRQLRVRAVNIPHVNVTSNICLPTPHFLRPEGARIATAAASAKQWARDQRNAVRNRLQNQFGFNDRDTAESKMMSNDDIAQDKEEELRDVWRRGFLPPARTRRSKGDGGDYEIKEGDSPDKMDTSLSLKERMKGYISSDDAPSFSRKNRKPKNSPEDISYAGLRKNSHARSLSDESLQLGRQEILKGFVRGHRLGKIKLVQMHNSRNAGRDSAVATKNRDEKNDLDWPAKMMRRKRNSDADVLRHADFDGKDKFLEKLKNFRAEIDGNLDRMLMPVNRRLKTRDSRRRRLTPEPRGRHLPSQDSAQDAAFERKDTLELDQYENTAQPKESPKGAEAGESEHGQASFGPRKMSTGSVLEPSPRKRSSSDLTPPALPPRKISVGESERDEDKENWNCPICLGWFDLPVQTPCGHTFCGNCLKAVIDQSMIPQLLQAGPNTVVRPAAACPICREVFAPGDVTAERALYQEMSNASVQCLQEGCGASFSPLHWKAHQEQCPMSQIQCPHWEYGCTHVGFRKDIPLHVETCAYEQIKGMFPKVFQRMTHMMHTMHSMEQRLLAQHSVIASHSNILHELYRRSHHNPFHFLQLIFTVFWSPSSWYQQQESWVHFSVAGAASFLYILPIYLLGLLVFSYSWNQPLDFRVHYTSSSTLLKAGQSSHTLFVFLAPMGMDENLCWAVKPGMAGIVLMVVSLILAGESYNMQQWVGAVSFAGLGEWRWEFSRQILTLCVTWLTHALLALAIRGGELDLVLIPFMLCLLLPFGLECVNLQQQRIKVQGAMLPGLEWGVALTLMVAQPLGWGVLSRTLLFEFVVSRAVAALAGPVFLQTMDLLKMTSEAPASMRFLAGIPNKSLRLASAWLLIAMSSFLLVQDWFSTLLPVLVKQIVMVCLLLLKYVVHSLVQGGLNIPPPSPGTPWVLSQEECRTLALLRFLLCLSICSYVVLFVSVLPY